MKHTVSELSLPNGSEGILINIPDASVMYFEVNFRAGEYLVEKPKWETPHLMEHVLLGANELVPKARLFQAEFEKNGAYSNASTGAYDIIYEAECADFEWDRIASLLFTAITKPLFLEEEFRAEFGNVVEELTARSNNHFRHLSLALRKEYGFSVLTDQERLGLIDNVVLDDIKSHYKNTHISSNMRFVIAGKITPERRKALKAILGNVELEKGDGRIALPKETPSTLTKPLYIHNPSVENLYFYVDTFLKRCIDDSERDALNLINTILTETLYSRILGTAREKGLVYGMSSGTGQTRQSTDWWFGTQVMPKNTEQLFEIMKKELKKVFSSDISEDDIAAAKQYSLGRYQRAGQTVSAVAAGYAYRYFFDGYVSDYYAIPKRIEAVSKNRIVDVSRAMFEQDIWGLGVLGSCGEEFVQDLSRQIRSLWQ